MASSPLLFTVRRFQPELVLPAASTPREVKLLSDIDDQQGVMFVEAEADVTLDQFGDSLHPPFPCFQELLYDVTGSELIIDRPLRLIQVTRLKCGGFIIVINLNHIMSDAIGLKQFVNAWAEMARGEHQPSIQPVWHREILMARKPPRITCNHPEYEQILPSNIIKEEDTATTIVHQPFCFRPSDIAAIRLLVPFQCTTFDLIAACFWYCRTKALQLEPEKEVRIMYPVNARSRFKNNRSSFVGYYGNCIAFPAAVTTAGKLCGNSLGYAVELIRKLKGQVTEEYIQSVADLMVIKGRCSYTTLRSCLITDLSRFKFNQVNFGWGEGVYGGNARGGAGLFHGASIIVSHKNSKGEECLILTIRLPLEEMKRFKKELDEMLDRNNQPTRSVSSFVKSTL
ncbi:unnamed protein product [Vicia faba]|uniref:Benzyl alcohol O-benzoyltransferase n=1 Tax=Vicia faba TaxID=3906 RepID=A0AAV1A619_VICFA|nr:unnamed protein product [Vicia faba]